jgi:hypothetical protein
MITGFTLIAAMCPGIITGTSSMVIGGDMGGEGNCVWLTG